MNWGGQFPLKKEPFHTIRLIGHMWPAPIFFIGQLALMDNTVSIMSTPGKEKVASNTDHITDR